MVGWVFCAYSIAVILVSPLVSQKLNKFEKQKVISSGLTLMGASFLLFGCTDHITDPDWLAAVSIVLRLVQGCSSAMVQTTCYSIAMSEFPNEKEKILG